MERATRVGWLVAALAVGLVAGFLILRSARTGPPVPGPTSAVAPATDTPPLSTEALVVLQAVKNRRADVALYDSSLIDSDHPQTNAEYLSGVLPYWRAGAPLPEWSVDVMPSGDYLVKFVATEPADDLRREAAEQVERVPSLADSLASMARLGTGAVEYGWYWEVSNTGSRCVSLNFDPHAEVPPEFVQVKLAQPGLSVELASSILARLPDAR